MTRAEALRDARRRLAEAGVENAPLDARLLLLAALRLDPVELIRAPERLAPDADLSALARMIARRAAGEPVARILGVKEFYGLAFHLTPATLTPRPDSERLVDEALRLCPRGADMRILDLGVGSGCLLLSLLHERTRATGVGVDLSWDAARAARGNAARLGLADRVSVVVGDWAAAITGRFDLILSNPPYIPSGDIDGLAREVAQHDPRLGLDGGPDGLDAYRAVIADLPRLLRPGGVALLEIGHDQAARVSAMARACGFSAPPDLLRDLGGNDRALVIRS